ncbi:hypothetical protein GSI_12085 [Ganoderma sinense ZZ0214-1]|uniref:Transporter n=1 Tax=Ganoderma sinense ZZ0214-1 TaxID=1077348 RepID=A0A2G8RXT1_9APHY|nr:hypothetical protein GSI_12085 [Ganoderma sinense ZZ0214-1]
MHVLVCVTLGVHILEAAYSHADGTRTTQAPWNTSQSIGDHYSGSPRRDTLMCHKSAMTTGTNPS